MRVRESRRGERKGSRRTLAVGEEVVETLVRLLLANGVGGLVRLELGGLERPDEVVRVNDEGLSTDLTETKRGEKTGLDTVGLDRLGRVDEVLEGAELLRDVVGVAVTGNETGEDGLSHTVEHPGGGSSLGVTLRNEEDVRTGCVEEGRGQRTHGEPLLGDDGAGVTLSTAEMTELLVVSVRLVLVVGDGRGSVEL